MAVNKTFCGGDPFWANACVGNNGEPGYIDYSRGFSKAANLLIDQFLADEGYELSVDDLVYPVCFNMRHSVELRLKGAIEELDKIARYKNVRIDFNFATSHDIGNIWRFFKSFSEGLDYRFREINSKIEDTILDIATVDSTGQTFRYPTDKDSKKHLVDVKSINFLILKNRFNELEENLDLLHRVNVFLCEEYNSGTFTSRLNRAQLYRIASELPKKSTWPSGGLDSAKQKIINEYSLSNKDFSRALDKIKEHYYLSSLIGNPNPILGVADEVLNKVLDFWVILHPDHNKEKDPEIVTFSGSNFKSMLDDIKRSAKLKSEIWAEISDDLSIESLAGLRTLYYFEVNKKYVEIYPCIYMSQCAELNVLNEAELKNSFMHILNKTNFMRSVLISLFSLGFTGLAEDIIKKFSLKMRYIDDMRSRKFFAYPDFADYK
ncbi:hypothetical protein MHL40_21540 [Pseudomonas luteola]|uniref:hypothetical protein n=1 Tax=Pseudomonas luteola TaxID=47886 RepID=UPI001EF66C5E|nr:hypothetical protein [Pseudomonas luteola]MCG7375237.1 hypothetical protein [Pseudomonas luteola]